jgi:hypothetical protein
MDTRQIRVTREHSTTAAATHVMQHPPKPSRWLTWAARFGRRHPSPRHRPLSRRDSDQPGTRSAIRRRIFRDVLQYAEWTPFARWSAENEASGTRRLSRSPAAGMEIVSQGVVYEPVPFGGVGRQPLITAERRGT